MTKLKAIFTMLLCLGLLLTPMPASFATGTLSEIEDPTAAEDAVIPITPDIPAAPDPTEGAYEYPITPWKTPEIWKTFDSNVDMINACQIPEEVLAELTTRSSLLPAQDIPWAETARHLTLAFRGLKPFCTATSSAEFRSF